MKQKDYVIVQHKTDKPFLMQLTAVDDSGKTVSGIAEHRRRIEAKFVTTRAKDVVVNLGPNPPPGKVYNIDVSNLYRKTVNHDWWGSIHFYVKPDDVSLKLLRRSLDHTAKVLDKSKLEVFATLSDIEIRAKKGKYAGMYHHKPSDRNITWYAPECCDGNGEHMDYIIYHELGHCIRFNGVRGVKLRQKWLRLYQDSIKKIVVPNKALTSVWNKLEAAKKEDDAVSFSEAIKNIGAEDEKYEKVNKILARWFKQVQHIGVKELNLAWEAEDFKYLKSVWPEGNLDSSDLEPVVSEYATTNVEELFAECFAFYMMKRKLPKEYHSLIEESVSFARANVEQE